MYLLEVGRVNRILLELFELRELNAVIPLDIHWEERDRRRIMRARALELELGVALSFRDFVAIPDPPLDAVSRRNEPAFHRAMRLRNAEYNAIRERRANEGHDDERSHKRPRSEVTKASDDCEIDEEITLD